VFVNIPKLTHFHSPAQPHRTQWRQITRPVSPELQASLVSSGCGLRVDAVRDWMRLATGYGSRLDAALAPSESESISQFRFPKFEEFILQ